jgi:signal transduction histidine kinase
LTVGVLNFSVDSALLRELGERLVGKAHIALAELIKNSYDADATKVVVSFAGDRLEVADNGSGMTFKEFNDYWMRIGSPHKGKIVRSPKFGRPLTGSKGVGRLSVQFLAKQLRLRTASGGEELTATINWAKALTAGELTNAQVEYERAPTTTEFPDGEANGTVVEMWELNQRWGAKQFQSLAREIWQLQPPFGDLQTHLGPFHVEFRTQDEEVKEEFAEQMSAFLSVWHARMVGRLRTTTDPEATTGFVDLALDFDDGESPRVTYELANCQLSQLEFEIRIFSLHSRQPAGIKVETLREYLREFGGVHVYDAGFHLPYYGVNTDWLRIELDHSHRLSRSQLLPESLQVDEGLNYLPTNTRVLGVVNVNTSAEISGAGLSSDRLMIQVTRDRLNDNAAFQNLRDIVRWALDYYATREALRQLKVAEARAPKEPVRPRLVRLEEVLDRHSEEIPKAILKTLRSDVKAALEGAQSQEELAASQVALLAPLATAGIAAVAYEHENARQLQQLEWIAERLEGNKSSAARAEGWAQIAEELRAWIKRARALRELFNPVLSEDSRTKTHRYVAKPLLDDVTAQIGPLARGVIFDVRLVDPDLRLPGGTYAEWSAVFQNVFANAINALMDENLRNVVCRSTRDGRSRAIVVEDTGAGVRLENSDKLFEPFVRRMEISDEHRGLGLGGTGLGLTIVRMIATNRGATVRFIPPSTGFATAFELSWRADG